MDGLIQPSPCQDTDPNPGVNPDPVLDDFGNYMDGFIEWVSGRPDMNSNSNRALLTGYVNQAFQ